MQTVFSYIVVDDPSSEQLYDALRMESTAIWNCQICSQFSQDCSHSLRAILTSLVLVVNSNYFDDLVAMADELESKSVDPTVKAVFVCLRVFAEDGPKAPPFASVVQARGVSLNVRDLHLGRVEIDNSESRRLELSNTILSILADMRLPRMEALRLRDRNSICGWAIVRPYSQEAPGLLVAIYHHAGNTWDGCVHEEDLSGQAQLLLPWIDVPAVIGLNEEVRHRHQDRVADLRFD
eukprot:s4410_g7.t1